MDYTQTELHTHLMGMLSVNGFCKLLEKYNTGICLNEFNNIDYTNGLYYELDDMDEEIFNRFSNSISIKRGDSVNYNELNNFYNNRRSIINFIIEKNAKINNISINESTNIVYSDYVNLAIEELKSQGVRHVEISFSNPNIIRNLNIEEKDIDVKFLLSTDRHRNIKNMKQSCKQLVSLIEDNYVSGFDIMGCELPLSELDIKDFKTKLELILSNMHGMGGTVLRIHSGEVPDCINNTLTIMRLVDEICIDNEFKIPFPYIRIGHGVYFEKSDEYINLLKKYGVRVEINASSNLALGNISKYDEIPYNYYLDNDIPISISTDGHGMYSTIVPLEDKIANSVVGEDRYNSIVSDDRSYGGRRTYLQ